MRKLVFNERKTVSAGYQSFSEDHLVEFYVPKETQGDIVSLIRALATYEIHIEVLKSLYAKGCIQQGIWQQDYQVVTRRTKNIILLELEEIKYQYGHGDQELSVELANRFTKDTDLLCKIGFTYETIRFFRQIADEFLSNLRPSQRKGA